MRTPFLDDKYQLASSSLVTNELVVNELESLSANLSGNARYAKLNGRDYIVAPLTMIVPGVLNGSKGKLFYDSSEIGKDPSVWNGVPITVYHPSRDGRNVSARDPDVLQRQGIGQVFKTVHNGKLQAEGWFDVEATKRVDNRVLQALESGNKIELSTGLFTDNEPAPQGATYNGKPYDYVAKNYRPDHLAILPDKKGACSLADGCGVFNQLTVNDDGSPGELVSHGGPGSGRHNIRTPEGALKQFFVGAEKNKQMLHKEDTRKAWEATARANKTGTERDHEIAKQQHERASLPYMSEHPRKFDRHQDQADRHAEAIATIRKSKGQRTSIFANQDSSCSCHKEPTENDFSPEARRAALQARMMEARGNRLAQQKSQVDRYKEKAASSLAAKAGEKNSRMERVKQMQEQGAKNRQSSIDKAKQNLADKHQSKADFHKQAAEGSKDEYERQTHLSLAEHHNQMAGSLGANELVDNDWKSWNLTHKGAAGAFSSSRGSALRASSNALKHSRNLALLKKPSVFSRIHQAIKDRVMGVNHKAMAGKHMRASEIHEKLASNFKKGSASYKQHMEASKAHIQAVAAHRSAGKAESKAKPITAKSVGKALASTAKKVGSHIASRLMANGEYVDNNWARYDARHGSTPGAASGVAGALTKQAVSLTGGSSHNEKQALVRSRNASRANRHGEHLKASNSHRRAADSHLGVAKEQDAQGNSSKALAHKVAADTHVEAANRHLEAHYAIARQPIKEGDSRLLGSTMNEQELVDNDWAAWNAKHQGGSAGMHGERAVGHGVKANAATVAATLENTRANHKAAILAHTNAANAHKTAVGWASGEHATAHKAAAKEHTKMIEHHKQAMGLATNALDLEPADKRPSEDEQYGTKQPKSGKSSVSSPAPASGNKKVDVTDPYGDEDEEAEDHPQEDSVKQVKVRNQQTTNRDIPQSKRDKMSSSDFAGPGTSFPIQKQEDVAAAAKLIGHADNPEQVKRNIIKIAKRKGFSIPDAWKEDDKTDNTEFHLTQNALPEDMSFRDAEDEIREAFLERFPIIYDYNGMGKAQASLVDCYDGYVIYKDAEDEFYKLDYSWKGDEVEFEGELIEVEQKYVPSEMEDNESFNEEEEDMELNDEDADMGYSTKKGLQVDPAADLNASTDFTNWNRVHGPAEDNAGTTGNPLKVGAVVRVNAPGNDLLHGATGKITEFKGNGSGPNGVKASLTTVGGQTIIGDVAKYDLWSRSPLYKVDESKTGDIGYKANEETEMKLTANERETVIKGLLTNNCGGMHCKGCTTKNERFKETDKEALMKLPDSILNQLVEGLKREHFIVNEEETKKAEGYVFNSQTSKWEKPRMKTDEEYVRELPPSMQRMVRNAQRIEAEHKAELIQTITSNSRNPFTKEQLEAMDVDQLTPLAQLAAPVEVRPAPSYFGASVPTGNERKVVANQKDDDNILPLPTSNFDNPFKNGKYVEQTA